MSECQDHASFEFASEKQRKAFIKSLVRIVDGERFADLELMIPGLDGRWHPAGSDVHGKFIGKTETKIIKYVEHFRRIDSGLA